MKALESLLTLIADGKPSNKKVDDEIDYFVTNLMENFFSQSNYELNRQLFDENYPICLRGNLFFLCDFQYLDNVLDDIEKSINRYSPFLKFDPNFNRSSKKYFQAPCIGIKMILEITPQMKKMIKVKKEVEDLSNDLYENEGVIKKQPKI